MYQTTNTFFQAAVGLLVCLCLTILKVLLLFGNKNISISVFIFQKTSENDKSVHWVVKCNSGAGWWPACVQTLPNLLLQIWWTLLQEAFYSLPQSHIFILRELGYDGANQHTKKSFFGQVSDDFAMDEVRCTGNEASILDCPHQTSDNCGGSEGLGVICSSGEYNQLPRYKSFNCSLMVGRYV